MGDRKEHFVKEMGPKKETARPLSTKTLFHSTFSLTLLARRATIVAFPVSRDGPRLWLKPISVYISFIVGYPVICERKLMTFYAIHKGHSNLLFTHMLVSFFHCFSSKTASPAELSDRGEF